LALNKERKEEIVEAYAERLSRSNVAIWANYRGVKAKQFENLRNTLRPSNAEMMVVKNTLMRVALEQQNLPYDDKMMEGPCTVTFIYDDIPAATRTVANFARDNEALFQLVGGLVGGKVVDAAQVRELVNLPSRDVLLARVVGGIGAPISGFVGTLSAMLRGLVNVLDAHRKQLEGSAG